MKISWEVAISTISEANSSEYWRKKNKRHEQQQFFVERSYLANVKKLSLPCTITLTRLSSRFLDAEENLPMAFKWIKDQIGACMFPEKIVTYVAKNGKVKQNKGHADSDPRVKWKYAQEKSKLKGIRIEIESHNPDPPIG